MKGGTDRTEEERDKMRGGEVEKGYLFLFLFFFSHRQYALSTKNCEQKAPAKAKPRDVLFIFGQSLTIDYTSTRSLAAQWANMALGRL